MPRVGGMHGSSFPTAEQVRLSHHTPDSFVVDRSFPHAPVLWLPDDNRRKPPLHELPGWQHATVDRIPGELMDSDAGNTTVG
jgi:hypothetical protein